MIQITELRNIIKNLQSNSNALDVIIQIFEKYYNKSDVEDLNMVVFINNNYNLKTKFRKLIDDIISFQSTFSDNTENLEIGRILIYAEETAKKYPIGLNPLFLILSTSHFLLSALEMIPGLNDVFESNGAGKDKLIKAIEENMPNYDNINKTVQDIMSKSFSKNNENSSSYDDEEDDFDAESFMESIGFPLANGETEGRSSKKSKTPMLDRYAKELTKENLDPVYNREDELLQLLEILSCKKKNNAILIGEPGVGKTSVVELLAKRIQEKKVPRLFLEKRIFSLDLNSLVAGTKYRGQYEERLQGIIEEVISNDNNIIIFIDEIHNLIGNGGSDGNGDAANILKPYLAKGKFQCIGSTTFKEYRKFIEKDGALKRRFQNIKIEEPSAENTITILEKTKKVYEKYHNVIYPKEVIEACVRLSGRYISDRYFPDKAIDALDLSGSLTRLSDSSEDSKNYSKIEKELTGYRKEKIKAVNNLDFETAAELRDKEENLQKELKNTKSKILKVTMDEVYKAIGKRSGVPIDGLGSSDLDKLRKLNKILPSKVIGQNTAIKEVIMSLQKNSLGIRDPHKPIASLLFVGPTGSGKTYLCKILAKEFFGSEDALIKYDMSEYGERHEVTKLTGASASFVGYEDEPGFEQVRKHPYSVVLFDEIEKASPEIYQIFLSILDEGYITLGNGIKVDFKNTIIIFTGNIGTKELSLFGNGLGYTLENSGIPNKEKKDSIIKKSVEKTFAPEFINRLSKTIIFDNLGQKELLKIIDLELSNLSKRLKTSGIKIKVSKLLKEFIISKCDLKYGARDLQRKVSEYVEEPLCEKLLDDSISGDDKKIFELTYKDGRVKINLEKKEEEKVC